MRYLVILVIAALFLQSCNSPKKEIVKTHEFTNDLIHETSPYLLQHAHNPVNWKPWNSETLEEAKNSRKLMIISIGYAACHWCHVMERESFEDSTVAAVMNSDYISVKVDREERPDVDQVYINAVQLMTGNAGWPLNVITLPDGRPVWGGTYFKKDDWIQAIEQIQELYMEEPQKLRDYADKLEEGIKSIDLITLNEGEVDYKQFEVKPVMNRFKQSFDTLYGGTRRAPKFMMPANLDYLLRMSIEEKDSEIDEHVRLSLKKMAFGGVYDQIGGGFARYSVDERWHVPHFEKMLYDNAQLVSLYSDAYKVYKDPLYQEIVEETLVFIERELTNTEGAFYSSLDADSETPEGELEEGAYYIYTEDELRSELGTDFDLFQSYYNINAFGKWENGHYVLIRTKEDSEILEEFSISEETLKAKKEAWKSKLLEFRNQRPKPRLDDKTLTSWNGLMLKGYVDAYKAFGNESYLNTALKNASFLVANQLKEDGSLFHSYKDGKSTINGYLEDYAAVARGFLSLYEVTLDLKWLEHARELCDYSISHFMDESTGMFFFTSDEDDEIITRTIEFRDNVIPASNSIMAHNLMILSHHYDNQEYAGIAMQMLKNVQNEMENYPSGFPNWLNLLENYRTKYYEIVVVGDEANSKVEELNRNFLPGSLIAGSTAQGELPLLKGRYQPGRTLIYVCVNNTCKLPVQETSKALELMNP